MHTKKQKQSSAILYSTALLSVFFLFFGNAAYAAKQTVIYPNPQLFQPPSTTVLPDIKSNFTSHAATSVNVAGTPAAAQAAPAAATSSPHHSDVLWWILGTLLAIVLGAGILLLIKNSDTEPL